MALPANKELPFVGRGRAENTFTLFAVASVQNTEEAMAVPTAGRQVSLRARRKRAAVAQAGTEGQEAALLDLLRAYHRAGAANATRQVQKRSGGDREIAELATEALAAFDCEIPPSLAELLAVLSKDGHRRWTDLFAQVSDRHMATRRRTPA